jgi:hypothetical protein
MMLGGVDFPGAPRWRVHAIKRNKFIMGRGKWKTNDQASVFLRCTLNLFILVYRLKTLFEEFLRGF